VFGQELIVQSRHYSSKMRAGALGEMKELLRKAPAELRKNLMEVVNVVSESALDLDRSVRAAGYGLFSKAVLPSTSPSDVAVFAPTILSHISW